MSVLIKKSFKALAGCMSVGLGFYVIKLIIKFFIKIFSIETHIALLQHSLDFKYEELELRYL